MRWCDVTLHLVVVFFTQVFVVTILGSLKIAFVPRIALVSFSWGKPHIACICLSISVPMDSFTLHNGLFSILVETENGKNDNFVVKQSAEDKENEPDN